MVYTAQVKKHKRPTNGYAEMKRVPNGNDNMWYCYYRVAEESKPPHCSILIFMGYLIADTIDDAVKQFIELREGE